MRTQPFRTLAITSVALLSVATTTFAADPLENSLSYGMGLIRDRGDIEIGGSEITYNRDGYLFTIMERVAPNVRMALAIGPVRMTQLDRPLTAGLSLQGYELGLAGRTTLFRSSLLLLDVGLEYLYERLEANSATQSVDLTLHSWRLDGSVGWVVAPTWSLRTALATGDVVGDERARGTLNQSVDIGAAGNDSPLGGELSLEWQSDPGGFVRLSLRNDIWRRATLHFQRKF